MGWREWPACHILIFLTFLLSGLAINAVQAVLFLAVGTHNRPLFRRINYYLVWMIYGQLLFLADWWSGSEVRLHLSKDLLATVGSEHALIVMNHHYEIDWLYGWMIADRFGQALGNARVCVKSMLRYVPVVGWAWALSDVIFLERSWDKDKELMARGVKTLCDYPDPMWYLIFAEGTRYTKEKYEASAKFAEQRGLPNYKHHLVPRTKGFTHTLSNLKLDKLSTLYDCTLSFPSDASTAPTLSNLLRGRKVSGDIFVRKIDLKSVDASDEEAASKFLYQMYEEKDSLKDYYAKNGRFPTGERGTEYEDYVTATRGPRIASLVNTLALNAVVHFYLTRFMLGCLLSGCVCWMLVPVAVYGLVFVALKKMIGITKISKSSSYGNKKKDK